MPSNCELCVCLFSLPVESEIMSFVSARLPTSEDTVIIGFPSQEDMVDGLLNITKLPLPGCFAGGAGTVQCSMKYLLYIWNTTVLGLSLYS